MRWWQAPAFSTGRVAALMLLVLVTFVEVHEVLR